MDKCFSLGIFFIYIFFLIFFLLNMSVSNATLRTPLLLWMLCTSAPDIMKNTQIWYFECFYPPPFFLKLPNLKKLFDNGHRANLQKKKKKRKTKKINFKTNPFFSTISLHFSLCLSICLSLSLHMLVWSLFYNWPLHPHCVFLIWESPFSGYDRNVHKLRLFFCSQEKKTIDCQRDENFSCLKVLKHCIYSITDTALN